MAPKNLIAIRRAAGTQGGGLARRFWTMRHSFRGPGAHAAPSSLQAAALAARGAEVVPADCWIRHGASDSRQVPVQVRLPAGLLWIPWRAVQPIPQPGAEDVRVVAGREWENGSGPG